MDYLLTTVIRILTSVLDFLLKRKGTDIADTEKERRQKKLVVKDKVQHILAEAMSNGYHSAPDDPRHLSKVWFELADIDEECGIAFRQFWNHWDGAIAIATKSDLWDFTTEEQRDEQLFHQVSNAATQSYSLMKLMKKWQ